MTSRMNRVLAIASACMVLFGSESVMAQHIPAGHASASTAPAAGLEGVVNINTASEDELRRLPGIGPARASAIVALRQRVQHFRAPDDLVRVRGIGRAAMRRLRPYVSLTGATTLPSRPRATAH